MTSAPMAIQIPQRAAERRVLANGAALVYSPNPYNQIVAVRIVTRLGSKYEPASQAGRVNLAMRLLSSGTARRSEDEIARRLEQNGAHFKAEAGKDWSSVDLLTTTHFLRDDLDTVMELLTESTFADDKLVRERELARMNILEDEDSPLTFTVRRFNETYYGDHPYAWPSVGRVETLDAVSQSDVAEDGRRAFDPSQLAVTVVGGGEDGAVADAVESAIARLGVGTGGNALTEPAPAAPVYEEPERLLRRETESDYWVMGYPGASLLDSDARALRLIAAILGGSMDSRLFREIRDKRGLCYQVGSSYSPRMEHSPLLIYCVTTPPNRAEAVQCAEAEIERLKREPMPADELERAKTYVCGSYVMSMETNMGQASRYAAYEAAGLGWDYVNRFADDIQSVSAEAIQDAANRLFTRRLLAVATASA